MNQSLRKANPIQETICGFAPATIANVNVGFDVLGISLSSVGDRVEVTPMAVVRIKLLSLRVPLPYPMQLRKTLVQW